MPTRYGRCTNIGNCDKADSREIIAIGEGEEFKCPECGKPLNPVAGPGGGNGGSGDTNRRRLFMIGGGVLLLSLLVWWLWPKPSLPMGRGTIPISSTAVSGIANQGNGSGSSGQFIFRAAGSTTIGDKLMPALCEGYLRSLGAADVQKVSSTEGTTVVQGTVGGQLKRIEIVAKGSSVAFERLLNGSCDIGMASRQVKGEEADQLRNAGKGDMFNPSCEHTIGIDGIAIIVNPNLSLTQLHLDEVARIFREGGGYNLHGRDSKSGTFDGFKNMVLSGGNPSPAIRQHTSGVELARAVAADPNGIGYVSMADMNTNNRSLSLFTTGTSPMFPTPFTVSSEDYLLTRRLYFYTVAQPKPEVTQFLAYCKADRQGQSVLEQIGFATLRISSGGSTRIVISPKAPPRIAQQLQNLTNNKQRVNSVIRFKSGSFVLDGRANDDIRRLQAQLSTSQSTNRTVALIGYSDNVGGFAPRQLTLSEDRAKAVRDAMRPYFGNRVDAMQFMGAGPASQVASNATKEGRDKNRRVEIWISATPN